MTKMKWLAWIKPLRSRYPADTVKNNNQPHYSRPTTAVEVAFTTFHMDFAGPFQEKMILVVVDLYKWIEEPTQGVSCHVSLCFPESDGVFVCC